MQNNLNYPVGMKKLTKPKGPMEHQEEDQNIYDESLRRRRERGRGMNI